jgi:hypothetical protein
MMHQTFSGISPDRDPGVEQLLEFLPVQVVLISDQPDLHPAAVRPDQRIPDAPQIQIIDRHVNLKKGLIQGTNQLLIWAAPVSPAGWILRAAEVDPEVFSDLTRDRAGGRRERLEQDDLLM